MKNWAGNITWNPSEVAYPSSEEAIQQIVLKAANDRKKVRIIGTGHSFTALCKTNDVLISLDKYQGVITTNKDKVQATVKAGTKLNFLGELLFKEGMAMENLGDIDVQSIAGTISTGTHGTGQEFGTISTQVIALRFVNGKGEIIDCSETKNQELFKAAQVSMGVLGIITQVTLQCVPLYKLKVTVKPEPLDKILAELPSHLESNRNFEFFWMPYTNKVATKTSNIEANTEVDKITFFNYWSEYVLENYMFMGICEFGRWFPSKTQAISKFTANLISPTQKIAYSHKIYATPRMVKFREMEFNVPADAYQDVMKEVLKTVNSGKFKVHFPIENRWVKGDDIFMSPANGRDSAYIACHVYATKDCRSYFDALEEVFRAFDGRPHWGKMNTLTPNDIADLYPNFSTFMKHRSEQDPDNVFISPYLEKLLGVNSKPKAIV